MTTFVVLSVFGFQNFSFHSFSLHSLTFRSLSSCVIHLPFSTKHWLWVEVVKSKGVAVKIGIINGVKYEVVAVVVREDAESCQRQRAVFLKLSEAVAYERDNSGAGFVVGEAIASHEAIADEGVFLALLRIKSQRRRGALKLVGDDVDTGALVVAHESAEARHDDSVVVIKQRCYGGRYRGHRRRS